MKLEWMGDHRDLVEALIRYCNIYAGVYRREKLSFQGVPCSYAQIQVLEYLLENEERRENMTHIAARLGITRSNFTKITQRLAAKGLVEKKPMPESRRETAVTVTPLGCAVYEDYTREILRWHFSPMFRALDQLSPEDRGHVRDALREAMAGSDFSRRRRGESPNSKRETTE